MYFILHVNNSSDASRTQWHNNALRRRILWGTRILFYMSQITSQVQMFAAVQVSGINKKIKAKNNLRQAVTNQGIQSLYRDCNNQTNMTDSTKIERCLQVFLLFFYIIFLLHLKYNLKST